MPLEYQVFTRPVGTWCNLDCAYCYALPHAAGPRMREEVLEAAIRQQIDCAPGPVIPFAWHGGEPTLYGLDGFRRIVALQRKHCPPGLQVQNGIQTNGLLLDEAWCSFLADEGFRVGLSLDGPARFHDLFRVAPGGGGTHALVLAAHERLKRHGVPVEALAVIHSGNARFPVEVYDFFVDAGFGALTLLPLVEPVPAGGVSDRSVQAEEWGEFLSVVFDRWLERDIGRVRVQLFEEAARVAFGLGHTLCVLRPECNVPVIDAGGDVYSCDHFVRPDCRLGNILETPLGELISGKRQRRFGRAKTETLPTECRRCPVLDMCGGGCPKNRIGPPGGRPGPDALCAGHRRFFTHCRPFVDALTLLA